MKIGSIGLWICTMGLTAYSAALWAAEPAGTAMLRFRCDGDSVGAGVTINGRFRGECPFDVRVTEGALKIRAAKPVGAEHERVFEQELRVGADSVKSLDVTLGTQQLTADARRLRDAKEEAERKAQAEREAQQRKEAEAREASRAEQLAEAQRQHDAKWARLHSAADSGDLEAMVVLADLYLNGQPGQPRDPAQAFAWYRKAADVGHAAGMAGVGNAYRSSGQGVPVDYAQAEAWLSKAAQAGSGQGMLGLARLYEWGAGPVRLNNAEFLRWLNAAAGAGEADAMAELAWVHAHGAFPLAPKDEAKAVALFDQAVQAGSARAFFLRGKAHQEGFLGAKNDAAALAWYQRGAAQECAACRAQWAHLLLEGRAGKAKNAETQEEAFALLQRAAEQGDTYAMEELGNYFFLGNRSKPKDDALALQWYRKAVIDGRAPSTASQRVTELTSTDKLKGPGLFCTAFIQEIVRGASGRSIFTGVWENGPAVHSIPATLTQFTNAMRAADSGRWHDFSSGPPTCKVSAGDLECEQTELRHLFGNSQWARLSCHPVLEWMQLRRARGIAADAEKSAWIPADSTAR